MPPPPPRTGSHIVAIALLILALIVLVSGLAVWIGLRVLSRSVRLQVEEGGRGKKEVSIQTPFLALEVKPEVNEARLGLPIYPGAKRATDEDSASVSLAFPGEQNVRIVVAKFETPDPCEKVRDFYKDRLGGEVTTFTERDEQGKTVFKIKHPDQEKVVALLSKHGGTHIELLRVTHGRDEAN